MNDGLYFFAGSIVTLAVVGVATWLRGPTEEQRRREAARAKRPTTPPPLLPPRGGAGDSGAYRSVYRQQPVSRRIEPRMRKTPPQPPRARKGRR